jgi:hypothetical protein
MRVARNVPRLPKIEPLGSMCLAHAKAGVQATPAYAQLCPILVDTASHNRVRQPVVSDSSCCSYGVFF